MSLDVRLRRTSSAGSAYRYRSTYRTVVSRSIAPGAESAISAYCGGATVTSRVTGIPPARLKVSVAVPVPRASKRPNTERFPAGIRRTGVRTRTSAVSEDDIVYSRASRTGVALFHGHPNSIVATVPRSTNVGMSSTSASSALTV